MLFMFDNDDFWNDVYDDGSGGNGGDGIEDCYVDAYDDDDGGGGDSGWW